jgi:penicillin-binding protein 2
MKSFGYGALTGVDIPGEKAGLYASPEWKRHAFKRPADQVWFAGETISMGIGQGAITVTPLQQAHFAAEIAERGQLIATPRLVSAIRTAGSSTIVSRNPRLVAPINIATAEQWQVVYEGMVAVVSGPGGTAYASGVGAKYKYAGKTGTAQVFTIKQNESTRAKIQDERKRDHAWFIAFAPAEDPKIAVAVLVENGGFGASAAAPIARKVLDAYLLGPEAITDPKKPAALPAAAHAAPEAAKGPAALSRPRQNPFSTSPQRGASPFDGPARRADAMLWNTPSRLMSACSSAAPKCTTMVAKNANARYVCKRRSSA